MTNDYVTATGKYTIFIDTESKKPYQVVNNDTLITEYKCKSYPQAIGVAEQYDYMLSNDTWKSTLSGLFGRMGTAAGTRMS